MTGLVWDNLAVLERLKDSLGEANRIKNTNGLLRQLSYLDRYGDAFDVNKYLNYRCLMFVDHCPYSFGFQMQMQTHDGEWSNRMNGGLIYHVNDRLWSVHT